MSDKDALHWDKDSPKLRENLDKVIHEVKKEANQRVKPTKELARNWHGIIMEGLFVPDIEELNVPGHVQVCRFRGEEGLEKINVEIGYSLGAQANLVSEELEKFEEILQKAIDALDQRISPTTEPTENNNLSDEDINDVIALAAWAHSEWVRIHPFANGNGRTARLWANFIATRYGLPPFARLRPRPDDDEYELTAHAAMHGHWKPTIPVFHRLYRNEISRG